MLKWPVWGDEVVAVVATGPSVSEAPLGLLRGRARVIAIKDAWKMCPWADVLYACDHHWWQAHKGVPDFQGLRVAFDMSTLHEFDKLKFLRVSILKSQVRLMTERIGVIGWGGNSGFHGINLAVQFAPNLRKLILIGFDMRIDLGAHFFGDHPYKGGPTKNNCMMWAHNLDAQAYWFQDHEIEVFNCSPVSALQAYQKTTLEEALR